MPQARVLVVQVLALTTLVAGAVGFAVMNQTVTLVVDGQEQALPVFARTVGEALDRADVTVGARDALTPSRDARLSAGDRIVVQTARPLVLDLDDRGPQVVWTTAPTVQAALDAFGVRSQGAFISVSRASRIPHDGLALQVRTPRTVTVLADGQRQDVVTTASTFGDVLKESGLEVRDRDRVSVRLADLPTPDAVVSITRVEGRAGVRSDPIPFKTITRKDSSRLKGTRSVVQSGRPGVLEVRYENVYFDGTKTSTRTLAKKVKVKPINRIVEVGTASIPKAPRDVASLNWKALAQCESTGRPTVVSPNGLYYGLYQFLPATWRAVGGTGLPSEASPAEQTYRAQRLYQVANWRTQWPVCGVRLFS